MRASQAMQSVFLDPNHASCEAILPDTRRGDWLRARVWCDRPGTQRYCWLGLLRASDDGPQNVFFDNPAELMLAMQDLSADGWGVEYISDGGHHVETAWGEQ